MCAQIFKFGSVFSNFGDFKRDCFGNDKLGQKVPTVAKKIVNSGKYNTPDITKKQTDYASSNYIFTVHNYLIIVRYTSIDSKHTWVHNWYIIVENF